MVFVRRGGRSYQFTAGKIPGHRYRPQVCTDTDDPDTARAMELMWRRVTRARAWDLMEPVLASAGPAVAFQALHPWTNAMRILVIEDERPLRDVLARLLQRAGHAVHVAEDGAAGLRLWQEVGADLVITDLQMPEANGIEVVLCYARQHPPCR
jgi:PleD family two-component response regulator